MKVSIITIAYNSAATIRDTIESVLSQNYSNLEYIVIDGASTDGTLQIINQYRNKIAKVVSESDRGIYDAMNKGIACATGDVIGILNSDDVYAYPEAISDIIDVFEKNNADILYGRLVYVSQNNLNSIVRVYNSMGFRTWMLRFGWMPPHPSTFIKINVYRKYGLYSEEYKTGADYEMFVRLLLLNKVKSFFLDKIIVKMRMGGATTSGLHSYIITSMEMVRALRENGFYANLLLVLMRLPIKLFEKNVFQGSLELDKEI